MKTELQLDVEKPEPLLNVLEPSLTSDERVGYSLNSSSNGLKIVAETDQLGALRGCTDNAFRLAMLADKIHTR